MANKPTNPQLYSRVKAEAKKKFDRWPSAYGSAWLVKEYKRRGGGYRKAEDGMEIPGYDLMANGGMMYGDYMFPMMDDGGEMALGQIAAVTDKMSKLQQFLNPNSEIEPWIASKLAVMDHSADAIYDYMMYNPEAQEQEEPEMEEMRNGGIPNRYKNMGFNKVGVKKKSNRPGKKWMVLAKKGDKYKVVHGGYKGMQDYTQHRNKNRQKRFWDRMGGRNSAKATDPFSPLYWHKRFGTWAEGGEPQNEGFQALPEAVQAKIMANMMYGGDMYQFGGMLDNFKGVRDLILGDTPEERMQTKKLALKALPMFLKDGGMPCYECGGMKYEKGGTPFIAMAYFGDGGIKIDPAKRGTFKAQATRMGMGIQEAAETILNAPEGKYSPEMRRKANFARNFAKEYGGGLPKYQGDQGSSQVGSGMYGVYQEDQKLRELADIYEQTANVAPQYSSAENYLGFQNYLQTGKGNFDIKPDYQYIGKENPPFGVFQKNVEATKKQFKKDEKPSKPGFSLATQAAYVTGLKALEALTRDNSAEKRYAASQTLTDAYAPVQRMNPFDWYGEYVTNQGDLLNPRQMTPVQYRGMDYPMYMEEGGQVVELDDKQIKQLLALGAEIEMLDE